MSDSYTDSSEDELPINKHKHKIIRAMKQNKVVCLQASTGSGKSTRVPVLLVKYASGVCTSGIKIACTQPRRVAAMRLSEHVNQILSGNSSNSHNGLTVKRAGYKVRGKEDVDKQLTSIIYYTTGFLKQLLIHNPVLYGNFSNIILDEVHERTVESDFLAWMVRKLSNQFPLVQLTVMSATIELKAFVRFFGGEEAVETVEIPNHSKYERDIEYMNRSGVIGDRPEMSKEMVECITNLLMKRSQIGSTALVFLPGLAEINDVSDYIKDHLRKSYKAWKCLDTDQMVLGMEEYVKIFPLHSQLSLEEQHEALKPPTNKGRHFVLATNLAESSLTVDRVTLVIDSLLRKVSRFDPQLKLNMLSTVFCSKASIIQREGRTGRVCPGTVIKLGSVRMLDNLPLFEEPEINTSDLAVLLLLARALIDQWHIKLPTLVIPKKPSELLGELITPPSVHNLRSAVEELFESGALLEEASETAPLSLLGGLATRINISLAAARLIYMGFILGCAPDAVIIACAVGKDVFRTPRFRVGSESDFKHKGAEYIDLKKTLVGESGGIPSDILVLRGLLLRYCINRVDSTQAKFAARWVYNDEFQNLLTSIDTTMDAVIDWIETEFSGAFLNDIENLRFARVALAGNVKTVTMDKLSSIFSTPLGVLHFLTAFGFDDKIIRTSKFGSSEVPAAAMKCSDVVISDFLTNRESSVLISGLRKITGDSNLGSQNIVVVNDDKDLCDFEVDVAVGSNGNLMEILPNQLIMISLAFDRNSSLEIKIDNLFDHRIVIKRPTYNPMRTNIIWKFLANSNLNAKEVTISSRSVISWISDGFYFAVAASLEGSMTNSTVTSIRAENVSVIPPNLLAQILLAVEPGYVKAIQSLDGDGIRMVNLKGHKIPCKMSIEMVEEISKLRVLIKRSLNVTAKDPKKLGKIRESRLLLQEVLGNVLSVNTGSTFEESEMDAGPAVSLFGVDDLMVEDEALDLIENILADQQKKEKLVLPEEFHILADESLNNGKKMTIFKRSSNQKIRSFADALESLGFPADSAVLKMKQHILKPTWFLRKKSF
jgi:superfamily II DNA/RNA helicase